jgi:hypothetical protein
MYEVGIVFKNGSKVTFDAQEFDMALSKGDLPSGSASYDQTIRYTYKDAAGDDAPIYLNPAEVASTALSCVP